MNSLLKYYKDAKFKINDFKEIQKLLNEIFALSLMVNIETNAGVWVKSCGHVDIAEIYACKDKELYADILFQFNIGSYYWNENTIKDLRKAKKAIQKLYKEASKC